MTAMKEIMADRQECLSHQEMRIGSTDIPVCENCLNRKLTLINRISQIKNQHTLSHL